MTNSPMASVSIDLPDSLVARCLADGQPSQGLLVILTAVMLRKNHYGMIFGPSNDDGEVVISKSEILQEMGRDRELFPMDYEDLTHFSGDLVVEPMGLREIESALKAHDIFKSSQQYPPGHHGRLDRAWNSLYGSAFKRIEVKIDVPTSTSTYQSAPPARAIHIMTRSIILR